MPTFDSVYGYPEAGEEYRGPAEPLFGHPSGTALPLILEGHGSASATCRYETLSLALIEQRLASPA